MGAGGVSGSQYGVAIGDIPFIALYEHLIVRVAGSPPQLIACLRNVKVNGPAVHQSVVVTQRRYCKSTRKFHRCYYWPHRQRLHLGAGIRTMAEVLYYFPRGSESLRASMHVDGSLHQ